MTWQDGEWFCASSAIVLEFVTCGDEFQLCVNTLVEWSK
jgi:hypothetical protein